MPAPEQGQSTLKSVPDAGLSTHAKGQWSSSEKFIRFEVKERETFERVMRRQALHESLKRSPFLPSSFEAWIKHRAAVLDDAIVAGKDAIATKEELRRARRKDSSSAKVVKPFGGRQLSQGVVCELEDYLKYRRKWWPTREEVVQANREMNQDPSFERTARFLVGADLMKKL